MNRLLQHAFGREADERPEAIAIVDGPASITYGQLERETNRLARSLADAGCRPGDRVGILVPKSVAAITGMIGALKAGCIYVPLDTASPAARLNSILASCDCSLVLAADAAGTLLPQLAGERPVRYGWLGPDTPEAASGRVFSRQDLAAFSELPVDCPRKNTDVAHILFTSGSTGMPKGVPITHASVLAFLDWALPYFGHARGDRISSQPPLHFDLSTFDVFGTLSSGATLYLVPPALSLMPHNVAQAIRDMALTQWFSVPSLLNYMARFDVVRPNDFPSLKRLLWCGEPFPTPGLIYWMQRLPHVTFTNLYGPTETTIASSYYRVPACPADEKAQIPIGQACAGEELLVLDENMRPVQPGVTGDLYVRGVGLSPGYWNDPAKTASAFIPDPFSQDPQARVYRTGDLASVGEDGLVYLHGRADSQIKSRGYRIELGEIEAALNTIEGVRECAATAVPSDGFEGHAICCAYVAAEGCDLSPQSLRRALANSLPGYMIPAHWMRMDRLPVNANGKIDRSRLRQEFAAELARLRSASA